MFMCVCVRVRACVYEFTNTSNIIIHSVKSFIHCVTSYIVASSYIVSHHPTPVATLNHTQENDLYIIALQLS